MARKGQIALFAGNFVPQGWARCDGENGTSNVPSLVYNEYEDTLSYIVATEDHDDYYLGFIYPTALEFAPKDWSFCDGQIMNLSKNTALFSLLGCNYGGDCKSTFGLPKIAKIQSMAGDNDNNFIRYMIHTTNGLFPMRS